MIAPAAVVLAAGRSRRYRAAGGLRDSKLVDLFRGEALVRYPVRAALEAGLVPVIVVTGHAEASVAAALAGLPAVAVHNPAFASGLASSLRAGLAMLPSWTEAAMILLGDMPLVGADLLRALIATADKSPDAAAVVPVVAGQRGNPVLLRRALFAAAATLTGDEGARRLLRDPALAVVELVLTGEATRRDVDEPAGLAD